MRVVIADLSPEEIKVGDLYIFLAVGYRVEEISIAGQSGNVVLWDAYLRNSIGELSRVVLEDHMTYTIAPKDTSKCGLWAEEMDLERTT